MMVTQKIESRMSGLPAKTLRLNSVISTVAVVFAAGVAVVLALLSLRWPLVHDLPILLYGGFLMNDLGQIPYRDFFEINPPGTMLLSQLIHQLSDGEHVALRFIDMVLLAGTSLTTILALRDHGWRSGVLASACFAIAYLAEGPIMSLQREYVCVLLLAISFAIALRMDDASWRWIAMFAMGLLAGFAICIKPPIVLLWMSPLLVAVAKGIGSAKPNLGMVIVRASRLLVSFMIGILLPVLAISWWLARNGALDEYLAIVRDYYPLYTQMSRGGGTMWEVGGIGMFLRRYFFGPLELFSDFRFVIVAFIGLLLAWTYRGRTEFIQCIAICGLVLSALAYVAVGGKFWTYHSFPLFFALALLAGLSVTRLSLQHPSGSTWQSAVVCVGIVAGFPLIMMLQEYWGWRGGAEFNVKGGRVTLVEEYLEKNTAPTDKVMVLDVTSGAIHALYRIRRPLHGRFIYDFYFYHFVDNEYVKKLRREMIAQFSDGKPEIVVRMDRAWGRRDNFPQLSSILENDYEVALQENEVSILRRRH